ncbi:MAG: hypothetical protein JSW68_14265, partial [Burkholderiales bacterium]
GDTARLAIRDGTLTVCVRELPAQRIGPLAFPRLQDGFGYEPVLEAEARAWIARFDRHTQRGGG